MTTAQIGLAIAAVIVGYFCGSINPAALIARARGIDLSTSGSGNPGATNAGRVMGKKTGVIVALIDVFKGFAPTLVFFLAVSPTIGAIAGAAAVVGHMTSPFLHGHGGKGVATTLGVVLAVNPWWLIPTLGTFLIAKLIVKRTGIASAIGTVALMITALVDHYNWAVSGLIVFIGALVIVRHHKNIRSAWAEVKDSRSPQVPTV